MGACARSGASQPCVYNYAICATGKAGGLVDPSHNVFCDSDLPVGATPNGAGALCYDTEDSCHQGTNGCGSNKPCRFNENMCATGIVASLSSNWFCDDDMPAGAVPNGGMPPSPTHSRAPRMPAPKPLALTPALSLAPHAGPRLSCC